MNVTAAERRQKNMTEHLQLVVATVRKGGPAGMSCADVGRITRTPNARTAYLLRALEEDGFVECRDGQWFGLRVPSIPETARRMLARQAQGLVPA